MASWVKRGLAASAVFAVIACSLVVDTDEIDSGCPPETKLCFGECVKVSDPKYGCKLDGCKPCERDREGTSIGNRFVPKCVDEVCEVDMCAYGFGCAYCKQDLLSDPENCGKCENACDAGTCAAGECVPPVPDGAGGAAN